MAVRAWDILVWITVIFPLVTGGIWIKRPGLFLELSEIGVPVLILSAIGLLLVRTQGESRFVRQSSAVRLAIAFFSHWKSALNRQAPRILALASLAVGSLWSIASLARHRNLESHAYDLGIFTNALWNLIHGNGYTSAIKLGANLFTDHQSPILLALAPLFALFPAPETLLAAQAFGLAFGGLAIFFLARQTLGREHWATAALPLLYWCYPPLRAANAFDFHPEVFMLPLFLGAAAGLQSEATRSRILGLVALVLALGCKESAGAVAAGLGIAWILGAGPEATRGFTRRIGWAVALLGAAVFYFDIKFVPEVIFHAKYTYEGMYAQYGQGLTALVTAPLTKPGLFWNQLLGPARLKFLARTLAPLAFLPLANPRALVAAAPGYLMLFLSAGDSRLGPTFHYAIEPSVGLFFAMPGAIAVAENLPLHFMRHRFRLSMWLLFWALAMFGRSELFRIRTQWPSDHAHWARSEIIPCLRPDRSVASSDAWVPHLSTRFWATGLEQLKTPSQEWVDCVILDEKASQWPLDTRQFQELKNSLPGQGFRQAWSCGPVQIFESPRHFECLQCRPSCEQTEMRQ